MIHLYPYSAKQTFHYVVPALIATSCSLHLLRTYDFKNKLANILLKFKPIKNKLDKEQQKYLTDFNQKINDKWAPYGTPFNQIPEEGLPYEQCVAIINKYYDLTVQNITDTQFSGTIYTPNTNPNMMYFDQLTNSFCKDEQLLDLYSKIFVKSYLWNSLHDNEFPVTTFINYQIVNMVGELFGGKKEEIMGITTTGGTQSIMNAARSYVNYGVHEKNISCEDCVIIAPDTIHASLMKAADAYHFKLVLVQTNNGHIDKNELIKQINKHDPNIVALFCSLPSYPYGTKDDYKYFAKIAKHHHIGLHVDCCLGGFISNFISSYIDPNILSTDGVTSISVDIHKNGLAPKGSSVLICKNINQAQNLMYYSIYTTEDWKGGLYGTPKDEGSQQIVTMFAAFITLLFNGKATYEINAKKIYKTTQDIIYYINFEEKNYVDIITQDPLNVLTIKLNNQHYKYGSTYKLADLMKNHGFVFNTLTDDIIHFCITSRFACNPNNTLKFNIAFHKCLDEIQQMNKNNVDFDGSARLYCSIETAINPVKNNMKWLAYWEQSLFGRMVVKNIIKSHFMAQLNPNYKHTNQ